MSTTTSTLTRDKLYIGGEWVDPSGEGTIDVINPTTEEVVGTMLAVAPTVGLAHLVSATVGLAMGLGYDIELALEGLEGAPANLSR